MVAEGIPGVTVAAFFQKDPQTLVAHPDQGIATLANVKGRPVMISAESRQDFWHFLKLKSASRTISFGPLPIPPLHSSRTRKRSSRATLQKTRLRGSEMQKPPVILLLANYSFENYTTAAFGLRNSIEKHRDAVRALLSSLAFRRHAYEGKSQ